MTTYPNYSEYLHLIESLLKQGRRDDAAVELQKLYDQGYHYGVNYGWVDIQDADLSEQDYVKALKSAVNLEDE